MTVNGSWIEGDLSMSSGAAGTMLEFTVNGQKTTPQTGEMFGNTTVTEFSNRTVSLEI